MFSGKPITSAAASNSSMSATSRAASLENFVRWIVSKRRRDPAFHVGEGNADGFAAEIGAHEPLAQADAGRQAFKVQNLRRHHPLFASG